MNLKHIMIVFKKEMQDSFRDKRSVLTNILLPLILIPLMYYFMSLGMQGASKNIEQNMKITILSNQLEQAEEFTKQNIVGEDNIEIVNSKDQETAKQRLEEGEIHCIITYPDDFFTNLEEGNRSQIGVTYNGLKNSSSLGM